jgi:hypothetical protein
MRISSQNTNLTANQLNPRWREAFEHPEPATQALLQVAARRGDAAAPAEAAGVVVPMSGSTLLDRDRLAAVLHNQMVPRMGMQACTEISAGIGDYIKMQHPEWHSSADTPLGVLAIGASSFECWSALQGHDTTRALLAGTQVGTNLIDFTVAPLLGPHAASIVHGICIVVRLATGFSKICVDLERAGR